LTAWVLRDTCVVTRIRGKVEKDYYLSQLDFLVNNAGASSGWKDLSAWNNAETLQDKLMSIDECVQCDPSSV
jgi:NADP-dependent 3-hydroxy acid dehydrogenase YdfG